MNPKFLLLKVNRFHIQTNKAESAGRVLNFSYVIGNVCIK